MDGSAKEMQNEENLLKVFLEASLTTKVEITDKSVIHKPDISDTNSVSFILISLRTKSLIKFGFFKRK
jgi:hypothetical protein